MTDNDTGVTGGDWEVALPTGLMVPASSYDVAIVRKEGECLRVVGSAIGDTPEQAFANGYLMAAAKKMRDTLEAVLLEVDNEDDDGPFLNAHTEGRLMEALAATKPPERE